MSDWIQCRNYESCGHYLESETEIENSYCENCTEEQKEREQEISDLRSQVLSLTQRAEAAEARLERDDDRRNCLLKTTEQQSDEIASLRDSLSAAQREREEATELLSQWQKAQICDKCGEATNETYLVLNQSFIGMYQTHSASQVEYRRKLIEENSELTSRINALQAENTRLREGNFTPEEFQNLCHNKLPEDCTADSFCDGCEGYQVKLFGRSPISEMKEEIEALKESAATLADREKEEGLAKDVFKILTSMTGDPNVRFLCATPCNSLVIDLMVKHGFLEKCHPNGQSFRWIASKKGESDER